MFSALQCFTPHTQASLFKYVFKKIYFNFYLCLYTAVNQLRTYRLNGTFVSVEVSSEDLEHLPPHLRIRIEKKL